MWWLRKRIVAAAAAAALLLLGVVVLRTAGYATWEPQPTLVMLLGAPWISGWPRLTREEWRTCSMTSCFDVQRCGSGPADFRVYIDPNTEQFDPYAYKGGNALAAEYRYGLLLQALRAARPSVVTDNASAACLFVPEVDVGEASSVNAWNTNWFMTAALRRLPHWRARDGRNYVLFERNDQDFVEYMTDRAIIVRTSTHARNYRAHFDASMHLRLNELCSGQDVARWPAPSARPWLASWVGSRASHPVRVELIARLAHEPRFVIVDSANKTAAHQVSYCDLLGQSTFGLSPRGNGLHAYRTLEIMRMGAIPVVYADAYVLPHSELLDWSTFAVIIPQDQLHRTPEILRGLSPGEVDALAATGRYVFEHFFVDEDAEIALLLALWRLRIYGPAAAPLPDVLTRSRAFRHPYTNPRPA